MFATLVLLIFGRRRPARVVASAGFATFGVYQAKCILINPAAIRYVQHRRHLPKEGQADQHICSGTKFGQYGIHELLVDDDVR
jgi:hypothetical protein